MGKEKKKKHFRIGRVWLSTARGSMGALGWVACSTRDTERVLHKRREKKKVSSNYCELPTIEKSLRASMRKKLSWDTLLLMATLWVTSAASKENLSSPDVHVRFRKRKRGRTSTRESYRKTSRNLGATPLRSDRNGNRNDDQRGL